MIVDLDRNLPDRFLEVYNNVRPAIRQRLREFDSVPKDKYFYEACFCICTPQSSAKNSLLVQKQLEESEFRYKDLDVVDLLRSKENYIRFHNQKANRLYLLKERWDFIEETLGLDIDPREKRDKLISQINGYGLKEASHFMRNIGYRNLAILDRHILKALFECGVIESDTSIGSRNRYLDVENKFAEYSNEIGIPMDELDLLFWYLAAGEIIK